ARLAGSKTLPCRPRLAPIAGRFSSWASATRPRSTRRAPTRPNRPIPTRAAAPRAGCPTRSPPAGPPSPTSSTPRASGPPAARAHSGQVQFLGVDYKDSLDAARAYAAEQPHPYPLGSALGGVPNGFSVTGPPETYFIDSHGVVAARFLGPLDGQALARYLAL